LFIKQLMELLFAWAQYKAENQVIY
jgi:hypothetical protein